MAIEYLWVSPLPTGTPVLSCWFPFQSTRSSTKPAPEPSGISCVGSAASTIRSSASAPERRKWWVTPSLAAGTRRMSVTPASFTQVSVERGPQAACMLSEVVNGKRLHTSLWAGRYQRLRCHDIESGLILSVLTSGKGNGRIRTLFIVNMINLRIHPLIHSFNKRLSSNYGPYQIRGIR